MTGDYEAELIPSFDNTLLAGRRAGKEHGVPLLVVNGIGANLAIWRRVLVDIERERPVVTWDYRGLHESSPPASDRMDAGAHAEDAMAVLDHYGIDTVAIATWSTGSRIALEIAHRYPERLAALAIVCGGYGYTLGRAVRHLELWPVLPSAAGVVKHLAYLLQGPFRTLVARPEITGLIRQSGLIAATADTSALIDLLRGMAECDLRMLLAVYESVVGDAAPELLREIDVPTLLVGGERDQFTPPPVMREMERSFPEARLEIYEKATHYLPIEYPARLSHDMRTFYKETLGDV